MLDVVFEDHYKKWISVIQNESLSLSSISDDYMNNKHFQSIVDLGPQAIPFIIQKLKSDEDAHFLVHALEKITKRDFSAQEIAAAKDYYGLEFGNQLLAKMWEDWWNKDHSSSLT